MKVLVCRRAVLTLAILIISHLPASSETHYVSKSGSDTPPYTSWDTAATSIQPAIDAASEGDTVLIAPGTFQGSILMKSGLTLRGSGSDMTTITPRGKTLLTSPNADLVPAQGAIVSCLNLHAPSVQDMTITNGPGAYARATYIEKSTDVIIRRCAIRANTPRYGSGGGIYALTSQLRIDSCVIAENASTDWEYDPEQGFGGGICAIGSDVVIEDCLVERNTAAKAGGGIFLDCPGKVCEIKRCEIIGNEAREGAGGGIRCYCLGSITDCVIANNGALRDGGGIWCGDTMGVRRSVICNNRAENGNGGGILYRGDQHEGVMDCVIANNSAMGGPPGDAVSWEVNPNLVNCTIVSTGTSKGSVAIYVSYPAETYGTYENITNCTIFGSRSLFHDLVGCRARYSLIRSTDAPEGDGNITGNPQFRVYATCQVESVGPYDSSRGITPIVCKDRTGEENEYRHMFAQDGYYDRWGFFIAGNIGNQLLCYGDLPEEVTGATLEITDFSLAEDSPCIDTGNNDADYLPETDKAGAFRIYRGRDDWRVDMGAYEYGSRRFEISSIQPTAEPTYLEITWNSQPLPSKSYSIYFSPDLLTWTLAGSNIPSQGETTSWIDPGVGIPTSRFYGVSSP